VTVVEVATAYCVAKENFGEQAGGTSLPVAVEVAFERFTARNLKKPVGNRRSIKCTKTVGRSAVENCHNGAKRGCRSQKVQRAPKLTPNEKSPSAKCCHSRRPAQRKKGHPGWGAPFPFFSKPRLCLSAVPQETNRHKAESKQRSYPAPGWRTRRNEIRCLQAA
jgi:hypothetical protein